MIDMGIVQGSEAQAKELIIGIDTVYVHTNIVKIEKDTEGNNIENLYKYHEIQYEKDEYIKLMAEKNKELETQVNDTQLALCDIFESLEV